SIAAWRDAGSLPAPRSHFAIAASDGYVYLTGGIAGDPFDDSPSLADVLRARIDDRGALVEWTPMTSMPVGIATARGFVHRGWLYVGGGIDDRPAMRDEVLRAPLRDHALGAWESAGRLPVARGHVHQVPLLGERAYSIGGAVDFDLHSSDAV